MDTTDAGEMSQGAGGGFTVYGNDKYNITEPEIVFKSESLGSVVKRKLKKVATNITLEPVMLFLSIVCRFFFPTSPKLHKELF